MSLALAIVFRSSQFATHDPGKPSRSSSSTSDCSPRAVRVTAATVASMRAPRASSRDTTATGRLWSTSAHQTSPCSVPLGIIRRLRPLLVPPWRVFQPRLLHRDEVRVIAVRDAPVSFEIGVDLLLHRLAL